MISKIARGLSSKNKTLDQLAFYSRRLKKEKSVRSAGFILMALTLVMQMVVATIPAERSFAASNNDILYGGVQSKSELVSKCRNNTQGVKAIYEKFGVTCDHIASGTTKEVTIVSGRYDYWSIGRHDSASTADVPMTAGSQKFFHRPLSVWGNGVSYVAYNVKANGKNFYIIKNCGNLTTVGKYVPPSAPAPKPELEIFKKLISPENGQVKPGDRVTFRIAYKNSKAESVAENFRFRDFLDPGFNYVAMDGQNVRVDGNPFPGIDRDALGYSATFRAVTLVATVDENAKHGQVLCNFARVAAKDATTKDSNKVCVTVVNPPPPTPPQETPKCTVPGKENLPADSPDCKQDLPKCEVPGKEHLPKDSPDCKEDPPEEPAGICVASSGFLDNSSNSFKVTTTSTVQNTTKPVKYIYTLDDDVNQRRESVTSALTDMQTYQNLSPGDHNVKVAVEFTNDSKKVISKTCQTEITIAETPKIAKSKKVTRDGQDIDGKKIASGDVLVFSLTTANITSAPYQNYEGEDYFGDVLDYADLVNKDELKNQGITLGDDNYLRWSVDEIAGNTDDVKTVTVKVKEVIPTTNRPSTNSNDYDCVMQNKYGNQVTLNVDCPLVKVVERTSGELPNTGPGTTVAVAFGTTVIAGYFMARARLLAQEYDIVGRMQQTMGMGV